MRLKMYLWPPCSCSASAAGGEFCCSPLWGMICLKHFVKRSVCLLILKSHCCDCNWDSAVREKNSWGVSAGTWPLTGEHWIVIMRAIQITELYLACWPYKYECFFNSMRVGMNIPVHHILRQLGFTSFWNRRQYRRCRIAMHKFPYTVRCCHANNIHFITGRHA